MGRTLISGGTVIGSTGRIAADVLIDGELIVGVLSPGQAVELGVADHGDVAVIDATGKYVLPGGVDVHTHMEMPFGGTESSDTFETGTIAAAWGGITTIVDFAVQNTGGACRTHWPGGTRRPAATARSTTRSTRSSAASTRTR